MKNTAYWKNWHVYEHNAHDSLMVHDFKIAIKLSWTGSHLQNSEFAQNVRIGSLFYQVRPLWA